MKGVAAVVVRPGRVATRAAIRGERLSDTCFALFLVWPALAAIFLVVVLPLLYSLYLSFAEVNLVRRTVRFTGLKNYALVFTDEMYGDSLGRTAYFVAAFVVETTLVGLGMALVLNQGFPGRPLLRSLLLIPWSLSRIVVGVLWEGILSSQFGVLNGILANLGLIDTYIPFYKHGFGALNALVVVYMWNQAPFAALLFLAALQAIPRQLYLAAQVDRANAWQQFRHITLPHLRPALLLVLILATVNGFLMIDLIFILTYGGPGNATTTLSWLGFQTAFRHFKFGIGAAILYTLTLICLGLTLAYIRLLYRSDGPAAGAV